MSSQTRRRLGREASNYRQFRKLLGALARDSLTEGMRGKEKEGEGWESSVDMC
jgi:hypothetical protein